MAAANCLLLGGDENECLPVLENLYRHGVPVTVASPRWLSLGFFSRYPRARDLCPDPNRAPDQFIDWVEDKIRDGRYPVTLVCGETATWLLSQARDRLSPHTHLPLVDAVHFLLCRDKAQTMKAAARLGVPTPKTYYPEEDGIDAVANQIPTYPVVLKPCISNGARGISFPRDAKELRELYARSHSEYGACIVQEFIPHTGTQYKVEILLDRDQKVLATGVYDKPRFYPPTGGSSTLNSTVERPDLIATATSLLQGISWYGIADCEFIIDPRDGVPKLMEVNPRFPRSIKILVAAGLDFPYMLYRLALGLSGRPQFDYRKKLYMRYFLSDCVWFLRSPERLRARPSFFWFVGRNLRYEIFSMSDPAPALAFLLWNLWRMLSPRERKFLLRN